FREGASGAVGPEAAGLGAERVLLVCTPSLVSTVHAESVRASLGNLLVAQLSGVRPHVPSDLVESAVNLARAHSVDLVAALGGGSAIGLGKAVGFQAGIPLIAVPTTYAGSEMTAVLGITDTARRQKRTVSDPRIMARVVLYDPVVTLCLPGMPTAATGINALAHCVEAAYSPTAAPFVAPVALEAISTIRATLPRCVAAGADLGARTAMLRASFLAGFSMAHAGMGVHHGLCHSLGGMFGISHGVANAIVLPHAMRYNADAVAPELARIGEAMGARSGADAGAAVFDLIATLGLPQRLRDVGLREDDLAAVAADALASPAVAANPKPVRNQDELLGILRSAW
ncbi:MAG TPA: iron-containing alcohol dehydrogenase, partial [Actinomycetota bacterium]|nr:iron-containing alcohol dehydrogenase [Actinomycetota bacterium]